MPLPWLLGALAVAVVGKVVYDAATSSSSTSYSDSEEVRRKAELEKQRKQLDEEIDSNNSRLADLERSFIDSANQALSPVISLKTELNGGSSNKSIVALLGYCNGNDEQAETLLTICSNYELLGMVNSALENLSQGVSMELVPSARATLTQYKEWVDYYAQLEEAHRLLSVYLTYSDQYPTS